MSKYAPLKNHFKGLSLDNWSTSFSEIEEIIGGKLPPSARKYSAWWSNDDSHVVGESWVSQGWERDTLNLERGTVSFLRQKTDTNNLDMGIRFSWTNIGILSLDHKKKMDFPKSEGKPGIYKLEIMNEKKFSMYIGEAKNISKRLYNYKCPGTGQYTSSRINKILHEKLDRNAFIKVFVCYEAFILKPQKRKIDFAHKAERLLFESVAIVDARRNGIELLNLFDTDKEVL